MLKKQTILVAGLIVLGALGLWLFQKNESSPHADNVPIGGEFELIDQDGLPVSEKLLEGNYTLINFGFTHCPDICPTTLAYMAALYQDLPKNLQQQVQMVFISVDPQRDTPAVLKNYLSSWPGLFIGLTGSEEQVNAAAKKYLVYHAKLPADETGYYAVDHSAYVYVMDKKGQYLTHFGHKDQPEEVKSRLLQLLN